MKTYTLEELVAELAARFGQDPGYPTANFTMCENDSTGQGWAKLHIGPKLRASWSKRLVTTPPIDLKTPRGPSEYFDLKFYS